MGAQDDFVVAVDDLGVFWLLVAITTVLRAVDVSAKITRRNASHLQRKLLDFLRVRAIRACRDALEVILNVMRQGKRARICALQLIEKRPQARVSLCGIVGYDKLRIAFIAVESTIRYLRSRRIAA